MLREEGGGGVEEGSRVTCVEIVGVMWRIVVYLIDCFYHFGICTNLPQ